MTFPMVVTFTLDLFTLGLGAVLGIIFTLIVVFLMMR